MMTCEERGFSVFAYDYEGYGTSEGKPSEKRTYQDEIAAYSYLVSKIKTPSDRVIVFGKSVEADQPLYCGKKTGGGIDSTKPFHLDISRLTRIPILPFDKFPNYKTIHDVHCPVLIIHGTVDSVIAIWHGKELYELANEPKSNLWVNGANHNDLEKVAGKSYIKTLQAFAASLQSGPPSASALDTSYKNADGR